MGIWGLISGREKGYRTEEEGCCNPDQSQDTRGHQSFFSQLPLLLENSDFFSPGGFPGGSDGKESACNVGGLGSVFRWGRSPGEGKSSPLQYSCLKNSMDIGTWRVTVHGVARVRHD